jgi:cytochrome c oxidase subunit II
MTHNIALTLATQAAAQSGWGLLNMPEGVTEISRRIYGLHMLIFWVCVGIGVVVFGVMIWSMIRFRKSRGAVADVKMVHNTPVEVVWTFVPVVILVLMAVPAARTLIDIEDTRNTGLTIKVTGYQWGWRYDYLDAGVHFFSRLDRQSDAARQLNSGADVTQIPNYLLNVDNPLVVPAGVKVRLLVTATDVIHAWWVPEFGMKKDAIPGFINEMWFEVDEDRTGLYRGQCTELCGRDHAFMPIVVDVRSRGEFDSWLAGQAAKKTPAAPAPPASEAPPEAPSAAPAVTDPAEQSETATASNASAAQPTA